MFVWRTVRNPDILSTHATYFGHRTPERGAAPAMMRELYFVLGAVASSRAERKGA